MLDLLSNHMTNKYDHIFTASLKVVKLLITIIADPYSLIVLFIVNHHHRIDHQILQKNKNFVDLKIFRLRNKLKILITIKKISVNSFFIGANVDHNWSRATSLRLINFIKLNKLQKKKLIFNKQTISSMLSEIASKGT